MITKRARREADYYLGCCRIVLGEYRLVTAADFEEWFEHDARGAPCRVDNPIVAAKAHYGQIVGSKKPKRGGGYHDGFLMQCHQDRFGPIGGLEMLGDGCPVRMLTEAFSEETVREWLRTLFQYWPQEGEVVGNSDASSD